MLQDQSILIVEDEPFIVMELVDAVLSHGGRVVGPVSTVADALVLLDTCPVDAAILDVQLIDRDITPVALRLIEMRKPLVIQTGTGLPSSLTDIGAELPVILKPVAPTRVLELLSAEMRKLGSR
ncbi:MAG: response regulator [Sphingomonadales bacterium]|jgi:AmiR/NasT family two-component response regulator|nr:MAG: response regulator [Sphingomonadales bacterium]